MTSPRTEDRSLQRFGVLALQLFWILVCFDRKTSVHTEAQHAAFLTLLGGSVLGLFASFAGSVKICLPAYVLFGLSLFAGVPLVCCPRLVGWVVGPTYGADLVGAGTSLSSNGPEQQQAFLVSDGVAVELCLLFLSFLTLLVVRRSLKAFILEEDSLHVGTVGGHATLFWLDEDDSIVVTK